MRPISVTFSAVLVAASVAAPTMGFAQSEPQGNPPAGNPPAAPPPGYYPPEPGYYPPPPGYYPPPGYGYPPPAYGRQQPPNEPSDYAEPAQARHGFLGMPYIGVHIPVGKSGDSFDPGFRVGAILGGRVMPEFSLNGEIALDVMNPRNVPRGMSVTEVIVDLAFSPLFHFGNDKAEGFVGPRIGAFLLEGSASYSGSSADVSGNGIVYGVNAGFAISAGRVSIGGIFSYVGRHAMGECVKTSGQSEKCDDSPSGPDLKTITAAGLVMF